MALKPETVEYITLLAQTYGFDKDAMLKKAEADEKALKVVEDVVPRGTFSRELDKVRAEGKQEMEGFKSKYYQEEVLPKWNNREAEYAKLQEKATRLEAETLAYRTTYGTLEGFQPSAQAGGQGQGNAPGKWISTEQYEKDMNQLRQTQGFLAKEMAWVSERHRDDFGKGIDVDAFEKHILDNPNKYSSPDGLRRGYADFVAPQLSERAKTERDAALKAAHDAGYQEAASKAGMPVDQSAPNFRGSPIFRVPDKNDPVEALAADPNSPAFAREAAQRSAFLHDLGDAKLTSRALLGT